MNILLPVFATVITIILWTAWANQPPSDKPDKPLEGSYRIVRKTVDNTFFVERYSGVPMWREWAGPYTSAADAQAHIDAMTGATIEVIPPSKPNP